MIVTLASGSSIADIEFDSVSRTFDGNTPPRPLVETYSLRGTAVATRTFTYASSGSGSGTVPTTEVVARLAASS